MKSALYRAGLIFLLGFNVAVGGAFDYWHWSYPAIQGNDLKSVTFGNGVFVAVGDRGTLLSSVDGLQWIDNSLRIRLDLQNVAFGNGLFVASGRPFSYGTNRYSQIGRIYGPRVMLTSRDGQRWQQWPSASRETFAQLLFAGGQFVAVSYIHDAPSRGFALLQTRIWSSKNGTNWALRHQFNAGEPAGAVESVEGLVFANGRYLIQSEKRILRSVDLSNWYAAPKPEGGALGPIFAVNNQFLGIAFDTQGDGLMLVSTNGRSWQRGGSSGLVGLEPMPFPAYFGAGGNFVSFSPNWDEGTGSVVTSGTMCPDGIVSTSSLLTTNFHDIRSAVFGNGRFVAVGECGNILTSEDGKSWQAPSWGTFGNFRGAAFGNGLAVVVGNGGRVMTSADGVDWADQAVPFRANLHKVTFAQGTFIAVGDHHVYSSSDGTNWIERANYPGVEFFAICHATDQLVIVGSRLVRINGTRTYEGVILVSTNGTDWSPTGPPPGARLHGATRGDGRFVVVGGAPSVMVSPDGLSWSTLETDLPAGVYLKSVAYGRGRYVVVGDLPEVLFSSKDGSHWVKHRVRGADYSFGEIVFNDVVFANGFFVAVSDNGIAFTSVDGTKWERARTPATVALRGLAFNRDSLLAVGNNDVVLQCQPQFANSIVEVITPPGRVIAGTQSFDVTLARYWKSETEAIVRVKSVDGTAAGFRDFEPLDQLVVFRPGEVEHTILVRLLTNAVSRLDRTFAIRLSDPLRATIGPQSRVDVTILGGGPPVLQSAAVLSSVVRESPTGSVAHVTIVRKGTTLRPLALSLWTSNDTATAGTDYQPINQEITFKALERQKVVAIGIMPDSIAEGNETFGVFVESQVEGGAQAGGTVTILDDESAVFFARSTYKAAESTKGALVTVLRSGTLKETAHVDLVISNYFSSALGHPAPLIKRFTFARGTSAHVALIPLVNDRNLRGAQQLDLSLANPSPNISVGTLNQARLSVAEDDRAGMVSFGARTYRCREDAVVAEIVLRREGGSGGGASVRLEPLDGTVVQGEDFMLGEHEIVFQPGEMVRRVPIFILDNGLADGNRTVLLQLVAKDTGVQLGAISYLALTIDDDEPQPALNRASPGR